MIVSNFNIEHLTISPNETGHSFAIVDPPARGCEAPEAKSLGLGIGWSAGLRGSERADRFFDLIAGDA